MTETGKAAASLLVALQERAKELNCLYEVEDILRDMESPLSQVLISVADVIPAGFQFPDICHVRITFEDRTFESTFIEDTPWMLTAPIILRDRSQGTISVLYKQPRADADDGPFLREEIRLLDTIADRIANFIQFRRLRHLRADIKDATQAMDGNAESAWRGPVQLVRRADRNLYRRLSRRMLNHLCWTGIDEAQAVMTKAGNTARIAEPVNGEVNQPVPRNPLDERILLSELPFELASAHLSDDEILTKVQQWMQEERASFFGRVLEEPRSSLREVEDALRRYHHLVEDGVGLSAATLNGLLVSLIRRFLSEQLEYIVVARQHLATSDFESLIQRLIAPEGGHAKLGGKGAGLFLAHSVLEKAKKRRLEGPPIRIPRTWYLASSWQSDFIRYNDLQDLVEQKYNPIDQVRQEYPNVIQLFKNSHCPPGLQRELSHVLDDLGDRPLIVRSSSLLEDRLGTSFSGKYKSLFIANNGTRQQNLDALMDAIAEIYASTIGPDPIAYRRERDLLEFNEEMGILIQEVVGQPLGRYFLPAFAGVAFSRNEFRWSPRIERSDGLLRMVPGLGTRAVDRVSNDYPVLAVPGKPGLRANATQDEIIRYSPHYIDVIDLETSTFETLEIDALLKIVGTDYPAFEKIFSVAEEGRLKPASKLLTEPDSEKLVATFDRFLDDPAFTGRMEYVLRILEEKLGWPVDIEFAHDGETLYLLQCRPQSQSIESAPSPIPQDVPGDRLLFTANRYVSNGYVPELTHIVYVDPDGYADLETQDDLIDVGRAVGRLNKMLPKRQFALMGPGRWGSRGDIKLGVRVTYADISNTAILMEIARRKGSYTPDLSFGTHFFQDLVEASIRYLPLYPDDDDVEFNLPLIKRAPNLLTRMLPDAEHLQHVVRVIDIPSATQGSTLRVLMNADLDKAAGILVSPEEGQRSSITPISSITENQRTDHWSWRLTMAEQIASLVDAERFGIVAMYVFGSTKNATAGPQSDIDLLVHVRGSQQQKRELTTWLEGWSLCLSRMNYLRTGYRTEGLLDVHIITDEDIESHSSFAMKIGAVTDAARELDIDRLTR